MCIRDRASTTICIPLLVNTLPALTSSIYARFRGMLTWAIELAFTVKLKVCPPTITFPELLALAEIKITILAKLFPLGTCVGKTAQKSVPSLEIFWALAFLKGPKSKKSRTKKQKFFIQALTVPKKTDSVLQ
ncbi:hypothetical protein, partial [Pedobacter sp. ASV12]|uniref:hypothetical protein n=1 Tax=Pedobacter sp. ASV12 TaxID=2795120 RepID=UPI001E2F1AF7